MDGVNRRRAVKLTAAGTAAMVAGAVQGANRQQGVQDLLRQLDER